MTVNVFKATNGTMWFANYITQLVAIGAMVAIPIVAYLGNWSILYQIAAAIVLWQVFNVIGVAAGAHRYFSHQAFRCNRFWEWVMAYFCMVSLVGPPCVWAEAHRTHHQHPDTERDPYLKWMFTGSSPMTHATKVSHLYMMKMVRKDKFHHMTLKYYWLYVLSYILLAGCVGQLIPQMGFAKGVAIFWMVPAGLSQLTLRFVLWTSHLKSVGYRNYDTKDTSNNWWFSSLISAGEGWHNNHHYRPASPNTGKKWWEFDLTWVFIKLIKYPT